MVEEYQSPLEDKKERFQRMKEMAERLFHEIKPKKKPLQIKRQGPVIWVSILAAIVLLVTVLIEINIFILREEKALAAIANVQTSLQRRADLFVNIVNVALNQAVLEYELIQYVADSRSQLTKVKDLDTAKLKLEAIENLKKGSPSEFSMTKLTALVEQYPQIKFSSTYALLINQLMGMENQITRRRELQNEAIRMYNTAITQFPWNYLAQMTGFHHYQYYEMKDKTSQTVPVLQSDMFNELLPDVTRSTNQPPVNE
ncbi:MAG: LemA family protein [SAR324 cluster bacterium]|nr:LemA family protein [SAR324 cluster bacterium]